MSAVIGVTTTRVPGRRDPQQWQGADRWYLEAVSAAGGVPVLLPWAQGGELEAVLARLDGLLLTGGGDLDPQLYGEAPHPRLGLVSPPRDEAELALVRWALAHRLPALGICRGAQVMVVALAGALYQDLPSQVPQAVPHQGQGEPGRIPHPVRLAAGSLVAKALGQEELVVNSSHHQAPSRLGEGMVPTAWSPDGLVEAVEVNGHPFLLGVQWHPEELWPEQRCHLHLFQALITAAGGEEVWKGP